MTTDQPKRVMISSTSLDLPEHRAEAIDACLRADAKPEAMEHLPAADASALEKSRAMVDRADVYIGIFAWRYGHIPDGHDRSITELEFDRAVERGIPILVFLMDDAHPITVSMVDSPRDRIERLRAKVAEGRVRQTFTSKEDLRGNIVQSLPLVLDELRRRDRDGAEDDRPTPRLHRRSSIPAAPEPYIAHPYTLVPATEVVGRQRELGLLTRWVSDPGWVGYRLLALVAIGGMGKSALTWKWFQEIAPQELRGKIEGRLWWSFYESDAHVDNFVARALAYVSGRSEDEVRRDLRPGEREDELVRMLDRQPFLFVLDGLERILLAYARLDAARLLDDDLDDRTANRIYDQQGIPADIQDTYLARHGLRRTADPRAGRLLQRLARVRASRLLVTTRLFPADLQTATAQPIAGCRASFLAGLSDDDALELWRVFGVSGTTGQLLEVFGSVDNYPLLIRALAGEVAGFRPAPGDFDAWREANPGFSPARLDLATARTHVLAHALHGLEPAQRRVLNTVAAFGMPAGYDTVRDLHVGHDRACADERELDTVLTELEDRGLLGWDRSANRYDLHPIVRSVVWDGLAGHEQERIYRNLHSYFDAVPKPDWQVVEGLDDLAPAIELYRSLLGLGRYDDAFAIYRRHLELATMFRLAAGRQRIELLEPLFPEGATVPTHLSTPRTRSWAMNALANGHERAGEPGRAAGLLEAKLEIDRAEGDQLNEAVGWCNLSSSLRAGGRLWSAYRAALHGLALSRDLDDRFQEAISLSLIGQALTDAGRRREAAIVLRRQIRIMAEQSNAQGEGVGIASLAEWSLQAGRPEQARDLADRAAQLAQVQRVVRDVVRAARLQGMAAMAVGDRTGTDRRLHQALARARSVNLVQEELLALVALAELARQNGETPTARDRLEAVWEPARRGPCRIVDADARLVLARLELDADHPDAALEAATAAYELAWCDGPPYAYARALTEATALLARLSAPEPALPPFDADDGEPLPDVDLNPHDEFWIDPDSEYLVDPDSDLEP